MTNIAVVEKGWLGGGNTGRNTTIIRSNYLWEESEAIYDHAVKLWETLSARAELQRHVFGARRDDAGAQHPRRAGVQAPRPRQPPRRHRQRVADARARRRTSARSSTSRKDIRYPIVGAALQRRGGTARHDAVAWGYARGASARGVDIIQNCEVTGIRRDATGRGQRRRDHARLHRDEEDRRRRGGPHLGRAWAWPACACRSKAIRCRRWSPSR